MRSGFTILIVFVIGVALGPYFMPLIDSSHTVYPNPNKHNNFSSLNTTSLSSLSSSSCKDQLALNSSSPEHWQIKDLLVVGKAGINARRLGKSWIGVFKQGVITQLKIMGTWGSASRNRSSGSPAQLGYGVKHANGISAIAKFDCKFFWENQTGWKPAMGFGGNDVELLSELYVYHIDRALGFHTVPDGKLLAITPPIWSKHFARHVCTTPQSMQKYMNELSKQHGELRLLAWVQVYVQLTSRLSLHSSGNWDPMANECGRIEAESSKPVVLDSRDPDSTLNYYKYALTLRLGMRWDTGSNCFFARHLNNPKDDELCKEKVLYPYIKPVNVDNDRLSTASPTWRRPCFVPAELREGIISISNFTNAVLGSIEQRDKEFLGEEDMNWIHKKLIESQRLFTEVQNQFRGCS